MGGERYVESLPSAAYSLGFRDRAAPEHWAVNGDRLALAEFDAMVVFDQELGPALADSTHPADRVREEVTFVSAVAAVGGWDDEGGHDLLLHQRSRKHLLNVADIYHVKPVAHVARQVGLV
jgi:hypothetical protein